MHLFFSWRNKLMQIEANQTLDTVMGFRHVCPPPVKLHVTLIVSAAQPRFGSIQYVPVKEQQQKRKPGLAITKIPSLCTEITLNVFSPSYILCSQLKRSRQIRAGLSWVPRGFFRLWMRVLRCCRVLKIPVPWSKWGRSMLWQWKEIFFFLSFNRSHNFIATVKFHSGENSGRGGRPVGGVVVQPLQSVCQSVFGQDTGPHVQGKATGECHWLLKNTGTLNGILYHHCMNLCVWVGQCIHRLPKGRVPL